ncbi:MAG: hypothetical protein WCR06_00310 [bacterium]
MKFLLVFLLLALAGTAGVYYGVQPLWQSLGWTIPPPRPAAATTLPPSAPRNANIQPVAAGESMHAKPAAAIPATSQAPRLARIHDPADPAAPGSQTANNTSGSPGANDLPPPATAPAQPVADAGKPMPAATTGSKTWGMTITCTAYYSLSGANRGQLTGGSIIDIDDTQTTSRGEMSQGRIERGGEMAGPYLVANADLVRFPVARSEVPPENIATLKQYYSLKGKLAQRLVELKKQSLSANPNPHAAAYSEAVQKYNDFGSREKNLVGLRDAASGAERMRLVDTLRAMIPEGERLKRVVDDAKTRYNRWKTDNPGVVAPDTSAGDAEAQDLRRQIASLEPQVKEIAQ